MVVNYNVSPDSITGMGVHHHIPVHLSKSQIKSVMMGGAINITPSMVSNEGRHLLQVGLQTAKKLHSNLSKNKGLRVALKPTEDVLEKTMDGGKISLKSIGNTLKNAGKHLASSLIHTGIPAATGALGAELGGPVGGVAGSMAGNELANYVGNQTGYGIRKRGRPKKGKGVFKTIKNVFGVNKGDAINIAKNAGKMAVKGAAAAGGTAVAAYTGNPALGAAFTTAADKIGEKVIDSVGTKSTFRSVGADASKIAKDVALGAVDEYVDKEFPQYSKEKNFVKRALQKDYPSQAELFSYGSEKLKQHHPQHHHHLTQAYNAGKHFYDTAQSAHHTANQLQQDYSHLGGLSSKIAGYGIKKRHHKLKKGKGVATITPAYAEAMNYIEGSGLHRNINGSSVQPYTGLQTLSPYANLSSPQMSPFIAPTGYQSYNPLETKSGRKKHITGGSFVGAGFMPSGGYGGGGFKPAGGY